TWPGVCLPSRKIDLAPGAQLEHIVRPAGLCAWPHIGRFPAAKGLTPHHGPSDRAVDIGVPHLDLILPARNLAVIQGVNPASEAEGDSVGKRYGFVDILGPHEPQHWAEAFGGMEERTGLYAELDAWGPETMGLGIECVPRDCVGGGGAQRVA